MKYTNHTEVLENRYSLDNFIHLLCEYNLDNCSGSAYRQVRLGYYKDGILLLSYHHSDNICHIYIASNPKANIILGEQDSRYNGNASPRLSEGELIGVWDGTWTKPGPWMEKINNLIDELCIKLNDKIEFKKKAEKDKVEAARLKKQELEQELLNNWKK